jgi:DNA-binding transcriptional ArsR family regulator
MEMANSASDREQSVLSEMFRLLGDSRRLRVLLACRQKPRSVTEIACAVGCSMALASHHLRLLRMGNLVEANRVGRQAYYRLADTHVSRMLDQMLRHTRHCFVPFRKRPSKRPA